jgi:hypothetical protein
VLAELRTHHYAVLSTVDADGTPHAAGVTYGTAYPGQELVLYVMTRRHLRKARDIAERPQVALVVPIERRILRFLPPATIQLHGRAEILDWTDKAGTGVFRGFWLGRRMITTHMVGFSVWELRRRMEQGAERVLVPPTPGPDNAPPVEIPCNSCVRDLLPPLRGSSTG